MSSAGEPTLAPNAVSKTLDIACEFNYTKIKLYTNGIRIGKSEKFSSFYLPLWRSKGLTDIYLTTHALNSKKNAKLFGITSYPELSTIVSRIHQAHLKIRANIVLSKSNIPNLEKFVNLVVGLKNLGFDNVAAWPVRDSNDDYDVINAPSFQEIDKMRDWASADSSISVQTEKHHKLYENGSKLALFPDGKLSNKWCT